ncbi:hypothetical protein A2Z67_02895 [Candidatus Woesebacteria bacterium RBG_13_36_22]|uniref:Uncharacterized protein n=1 Tax=Candidatus Woesebacteria bacterium RBG_13_36_22 TaxID=1802478 RepID=A0A1F7X5P1_9BACT|nr:MAG: hypothetical protein A2Z67_02895 [Candidatus Woesebacteria bacterium RBG_13_36_22]
MLKKLIILAFILTLGIFVAGNPVYSQELPQEDTEITFDQAYANYMGFIEEYNKAHDEYILKRAQHLKFQSLVSKQAAFDATLLMLQKRDQVVISYLNVLEAKVREGRGIPDAKRNDLSFRIDEEIEWFSYHRDNLTTTGSLDDLVADSKLASSRQLAIDPLAYEAMSVLSQGKITDFSERLDGIFSELKSKLETIREDEREEYSFSSSKFQILDRWIFEADGRIVRGEEKQNEADLLIGQIVKVKKTVSGSYQPILTILDESKLYMSEANLFLKEIIKQVKTEE